MTKEEFDLKEKAWNVDGSFLCYNNCGHGYGDYPDRYSSSSLVWTEIFKGDASQEKGWFCKSCVSNIDLSRYNIKQGETLADFIKSNFDLVVKEGYI